MICASCVHGATFGVYMIAVECTPAPRDAFCSPEVGAVDGVEMKVLGPGHRRGDVVGRGGARPVRAPVRKSQSLGDEGRAVDRVVHRPPQPHVREERPARVHDQPSPAEHRADEVPLVSLLGGFAAGTVLRLQPWSSVRRNPVERVVGGARLDLLEGTRRVDADRDDDLLESVRTVTVVVGIAPEHDLLSRWVRRDVVGTG